MKLEAFYSYLRGRADSRFGGRLDALWEALGTHKVVFYRRFRRFPWEAGGGGDGKMAKRLAERLQDSLSKILWLMGYNPFVSCDLTEEELTLMHELNLRLVPLIKSGQLADVNSFGELGGLLGVTLAALQRLAEKRSLASRSAG